MNSMLDWPEGFERTDPAKRRSNSKFEAGYRQTRKEIRKSLELAGADQFKIDTVTEGDPGVVVRWISDGEQYAIACDHYEGKKDNLRSIYLWLEETRKRSDRPVVTGGDEFAAARLMPPGEETVSRPPAHEVLQVSPNTSKAVVKAAYKERAKELHPDQGGSEDEFETLQWAKEQML